MAPLRIGWVFSLIRSGSSATAYAAASAWGYPIADEAFGPWVRTGKVYAYPETQRDLVRAFKDASWTLSDEVVELANRLFAQLGAEAGGVVSKHPHLDFEPEDFRARFPDHGAVFLIRNPLHRLNSIHARGLLASLRPNHDIDHYKEFARRWLRQPAANRLVFDDLKRHPHAYYKQLFEAWNWDIEDSDVDKAATYSGANYHSSCKEIEGSDPDKPVSESAPRLLRRGHRSLSLRSVHHRSHDRARLVHRRRRLPGPRAGGGVLDARRLALLDGALRAPPSRSTPARPRGVTPSPMRSSAPGIAPASCTNTRARNST